MNISDPAVTPWGKLTSLNPHFQNILLSKTPSVLTISDGLVEASVDDNSSSSESKFQIYQENDDFFVCSNGSGLSVHIEDQILKEGEKFQIHIGDKIIFSMKNQMEYIFSAELGQAQKNILKRDREETEEVLLMEKQIKFYDNMESETKCGVCKKMIYECASVVPCLHRFCIECLFLHLKIAQKCPECGQKCKDFRKDVFLNNIIEAYEESGYTRHPDEKERLERERIISKFQFTNGEFYEGEWKKFRKDGKGKFLFKNGNYYTGDWRSDKREGQGIMFYQNGDHYTGNWKNNQREGVGIMIYSNGEFYDGDWKNNESEGKGKTMNKNGDFYKGDWKNDRMEGEGEMNFSNGDYYKGDWKNNQREGQGEMNFSNGDHYTGEWKNNQREGVGIMVYRNEELYDGDWKNNQREGVGNMIYKNGDFYTGDWRNNQREGKGKMKFNNGDYYTGDWKNNQREGQGIMQFKSGDFYSGNWKNDKAERKGKTILYWNGQEMVFDS